MKKRRREEPWFFVIGGAQRGGAEGQFVRLASLLRASGAPVECVFLFGGGPLLAELDEAGVPRHVLRSKNPRSRALRAASLAVAVLRLALLLRRSRPSVVMAWLTFATWPTLLLADILTSAARVAGIRGEILRSEVRWATRLFRRALRRADAVIVNSPSLVREAQSWGASLSRITVIPNGVDQPVRMADPASVTTAIVVSNYRPYKGHTDLLQALTRVTSDVRVRLCGAGDAQHQIEQLAADLGVRDRVEFVEQPVDVKSELTRAGFAVHPSRTEGLSNAILEEMAFGLPVVAMAVGGNPTLVDPGVNGYLLEVGDHAELAAVIDRLAQNPDLRRRLGEGSRSKSHQFSWEMCALRYREILSSLPRTKVSSGTIAS